MSIFNVLKFNNRLLKITDQPVWYHKQYAMKKIILTSLVLLLASGQAQTLQEAITKTDNENFETADKMFKSLIAKDPSKGEYYFYYGENFNKRDEVETDIDSANIIYSKGAEINATNPLNYVGLGKVLLKKNKVDEAKTQFFKANTLGANKNAEVLRKIAETWLVTNHKNPDEAISLLNAAIKLDPKNPENYILLGDAQLEKNPTDGSGPVKSYQMATTLNPKSPKGILREGTLYRKGRNYQLALDYYKKAIALDPTYAPAYREIAELYFLAGQPAKSIENWKKYLELNNSDYARYRFMSALFSNKQYGDAVSQYEGLLKSNFSSVYLHRLAGYSYAEMGNKTDTGAYTKGLAAINKFFNMAGPGFKYLPQDYKYKGILLARTGKDSLGMIELERAISMDTAAASEIYSTMSTLAMKNKRYDQVINYLERKTKGNYNKLNINDAFDLGKAYYFTGAARQKEANEMKDAQAKKKKPTDTPEIKAKEGEAMTNFVKADSAFKKLTQLNSTWPWGYTWRGRANASIDPDAKTDSTKVQYEKVISLVKPEERTGSYKSNVIEAYEYLGFYYVTKKDEEKAKENWTIVKELDPNNEKAKYYFNPPKPKAPAPKPKQ
jgi:tetratricopeptide (TPR) repeat protein